MNRCVCVCLGDMITASGGLPFTSTASPAPAVTVCISDLITISCLQVLSKCNERGSDFQTAGAEHRKVLTVRQVDHWQI